MKRKLRGVLYDLAMRKVIYDYVEYCTEPPTRRALLSYLVHPLLPPPRLRDKVQFSNQGIAQQIPRVLNELGYAVDIVDYRNTNWVPSRSYDLFIGHGGHTFVSLAEKLEARTRRLYFASGIHWKEMNVRAMRRLYEVTARRGCIISAERVGNYEGEDQAYRASDGIICIGDKRTLETFHDTTRRVVCVSNAAYPVDSRILQKEKFPQSQSRFLFLAGRGNIHKGLDLLLEAFAGTDLHLHVCQHMQPDFARAFRRELTEFPNIHLEGYVRMRSPKFLELAQKCHWVILPTCAEGQPGSVLECMAYGLVPVLTREANIDLEDWGISIPELTVDSVRATAHWASQMPQADSLQRSQHVAQVARKTYSVEAFRTSFRMAVLRLEAAGDANAAEAGRLARHGRTEQPTNPVA